MILPLYLCGFQFQKKRHKIDRAISNRDPWRIAPCLLPYFPPAILPAMLNHLPINIKKNNIEMNYMPVMSSYTLPYNQYKPAIFHLFPVINQWCPSVVPGVSHLFPVRHPSSIFHYKPSIWGYPHLWNPLYVYTGLFFLALKPGLQPSEEHAAEPGGEELKPPGLGPRYKFVFVGFYVYMDDV